MVMIKIIKQKTNKKTKPRNKTNQENTKIQLRDSTQDLNLDT